MNRLTFSAAWTLLFTLVASLMAVRAEPQVPVPAAPADRDDPADVKLVQSVCGGCHAMGALLGLHRTRHDWEGILEWMSDEGAVMTDEEYTQMLQFLTVRYGIVTVNSAALEDVQAVLELTDEQTTRLVAARAAGSSFRTLVDLAKTLDVPVAVLESRRARIDFTAPPGP